MKLKQINVGLAAAVAITLVQSVSASVVVAGFYSFENMKPVTSTDDTVDYVNPDYAGVSGWVTSPRQSSQADNGSWDTTYGNGPSTLPSQPAWGYSNVVAAPSQGDGMGNIKLQGGVPSDHSMADYSVLSFWVKNDGDSVIPLDRLYFDVASNPPAGTSSQTMLAKYYMGAFNPNDSLTWWAAGTALGEYSLSGVTTVNDYLNYSKSLSGVMLGAGETIAFMFSGRLAEQLPGGYAPTAFYVDNVGITAIPEPGSVLGLGCVLASGLMLRSRRKTNRLDLP